VLQLDMPGADKKRIQITYEPPLLTVEGRTNRVRRSKGEELLYTDLRQGTYRRAFTLPEDIHAEKITAHFENGVLTVRVPKSRQVVEISKKIEITHPE